MPEIKLFTIGFTEKSAERFFELLQTARVRTLIDTRINNASQLAGFAKGRDLAYFCRAIGGIEYVHRLDMAPTREMLAEYRRGELDWEAYEDRYLALLRERGLRDRVDRQQIDHGCLLCSEHLPDHCHRRLLADYLSEWIPELCVTHLH
jgi:uncharacterized protein (DUF488 family)